MQDVNPNDFSNTAEADKSLLVKFFLKSAPDKQATADKGHPVFKDVEYIQIAIPGKRDPQACRPATVADKQRFPDHYDRFQRRVEEPESGWPLIEWPAISRSLAENLSFHNIKTVEQLAAANDNALGGIMGGLSYKQKAIDALAQASDSTVAAARVKDLEAKNATLMEDNSTLAGKVDKLTGQVEALIDRMAAGEDAEEEVKTFEAENKKSSGTEKTQVDADSGPEAVATANTSERRARRSRAAKK